jgi:hypothetical protein
LRGENERRQIFVAAEAVTPKARAARDFVAAAFAAATSCGRRVRRAKRGAKLVKRAFARGAYAGSRLGDHDLLIVYFFRLLLSAPSTVHLFERITSDGCLLAMSELQ